MSSASSASLIVDLRLFHSQQSSFLNSIAFFLKSPSVAVRSTRSHALGPVFNSNTPTSNCTWRDTNLLTADVFTLETVRSTLIRQEETIIFALIERAQYRTNDIIYDCKANNLNSVYGAPLSFLEWMLIETEKLHSKVRRYTSPEEYAFFPAYLPPPILPPLKYPGLIPDKGAFDVNSEVFRWYIGHVIPQLCVHGDDEQHGSSVLCDITALQAISRRVHYGKFVAESKFLQDPEVYTKLAMKGDVLGMLKLLTNVEVERGVLRRSFAKASTYGQDSFGKTEGNKVNPMLIAELYRDMIIPLTKDVEIRYLFQRVGLQSPAPDTYYENCKGPLDAFDTILATLKFKHRDFYHIPDQLVTTIKSFLSLFRTLSPRFSKVSIYSAVDHEPSFPLPQSVVYLYESFTVD
eukprot:gene1237-2404_t